MITSASSGLLSFRSNLAARVSPEASPFNSSILWIVLDSYPVASVMRFAALPVGAARKISIPSDRKYRMITLIVVVLPVPGPPDRTKIPFLTLSSTDLLCSSSSSRFNSPANRSIFTVRLSSSAGRSCSSVADIFRSCSILAQLSSA